MKGAPSIPNSHSSSLVDIGVTLEYTVRLSHYLPFTHDEDLPFLRMLLWERVNMSLTVFAYYRVLLRKRCLYSPPPSPPPPPTHTQIDIVEKQQIPDGHRKITKAGSNFSPAKATSCSMKNHTIYFVPICRRHNNTSV